MLWDVYVCESRHSVQQHSVSSAVLKAELTQTAQPA